MVCFTDVPLRHSSEHCKRYGRFGIAFQKLKLMNVGAQPVFYASHACKRDMDTIFHFLQEQVQQTTLPSICFEPCTDISTSSSGFLTVVLMAMTRSIMNGSGDSENRHSSQRRNSVARMQNTGLREKVTPYTGKLVTEGDKSYFAFSREDIAFLIAPRNCHGKIENPNGFQIVAYEDLINEKHDED